jgi:transcriptional regulator with XRE-family HTH domain
MAFEEICFPNNLRRIRMERGVKMTEIARRTGLSLSAMSKIEKGYRRINQKIMVKLCDCLNCKISDLFIKETDKDDVATWQNEMSRRVENNENRGLKIFGSGLRHIRKSLGKTIVEAAKESKMTLSVYHNIEVGKRDVYESELSNLAKMTGRAPEVLIKEIYQLHEAGKLKDTKNAEKEDVPQSIAIPGSGMLGGVNVSGVLYGAKMYELTRSRMIPVFGMPEDKHIAFKKSDEKMIIAPSSLEGRDDVYAVIPNSKRMAGVLPSRSYVIVDPKAQVQIGDIAVLLSRKMDEIKIGEKATANIIVIKEDFESGKTFGVMFNPDEKIEIKSGNRGTLHKVIQIIIE